MGSCCSANAAKDGSKPKKVDLAGFTGNLSRINEA